MKSKPKNKKLKVEVTALGPPVTPSLSPACSTTSNASSLLSTGHSINVRRIAEALTDQVASSSTTAKSSNAKAKGGTGGGAKEAAKGSVGTAQTTASGLLSDPILTNFNLMEFPKIKACITGRKMEAGVQANIASPAVSDLNRPIENLSMEDLDPLQAELETIWSNVAFRIHTLHREQLCLHSTSGPVASVTHHLHNLGLEHFNPQHQENTASVAAVAAIIPYRSHSVSSDFGVLTAEGVVNENHVIPTQFWESIEAYCPDLTKEDIDGLTAVLDEQGVLENELFDIPPLGKHFKDTEKTASKKAKDSRVNSSKDCVGLLTQRLVSALVEEKVSMFNNKQLNSPEEDASLAISTNNNPKRGYYAHKPGLARALGLDAGGGGANAPSLENSIRDCLVEHGMSPHDHDANDPSLLDPDDEILAEIKRTQSVLKKLHSYNAEKLTALIETGKRSIDRSVTKRDLDEADKDVYEVYKSIASCRVENKPITKKEKDSATKSLETRKRVLSKLKSIHDPNGPSQPQ